MAYSNLILISPECASVYSCAPLPLRGGQVSLGRDDVTLGPEPVEEFGILLKVFPSSCI